MRPADRPPTAEDRPARDMRRRAFTSDEAGRVHRSRSHTSRCARWEPIAWRLGACGCFTMCEGNRRSSGASVLAHWRAAPRPHRPFVRVGQSTTDQACFIPTLRATELAAASLHADGSPEHVVGTVLADVGYSDDASLSVAGPDRLIVLGMAGIRPRPPHKSLRRAYANWVNRR